MDIPKRTELAFDYARDSTKQLMTLATGVIALTITFARDFVGGAPQRLRWYVIGSWILLLISVAFGQLCLMALTGVLGSREVPPPVPSIYNGSIVAPSILQVLTFGGGLALAVVFAARTLGY